MNCYRFTFHDPTAPDGITHIIDAVTPKGNIPRWVIDHIQEQAKLGLRVEITMCSREKE